MNQERSARLRKYRPFKIRHRPWFGTTNLNGIVWEFQLRCTSSPIGFVCIQVRDGGPFNDYVSFDEALRRARERRDQLRRYGYGYTEGEMDEMDALERTRKP